jgi:hypothetical protein
MDLAGEQGDYVSLRTGRGPHLCECKCSLQRYVLLGRVASVWFTWAWVWFYGVGSGWPADASLAFAAVRLSHLMYALPRLALRT